MNTPLNILAPTTSFSPCGSTTPFASLDADAIAAGCATIPAIHNASQWLCEKGPEVKQILPQLLDRESKMLINGSSKCRKTFLAMQLAISLSAGQAFLKWHPPQSFRVLILNGEVSDVHSHRRLVNMCKAVNVTPRDLGDRLQVINSRGQRFTMDNPPDWLLAAAANVDLIIIDPVYKYFQGEENSGADAAAFLAGLDLLCSQSGAAAVYVHHAAKGTPGDRQTIDRGSGSGVFARDFDAALYLGLHRDEPDTRVVEPIIRAYPPVEPFCIKFQNGAFTLSDAAPVVQTSANRQRTPPALLIPTIMKIVEQTGPTKKTELIENIQQAGASREAARKAIDAAIAGGQLLENSGHWHNSKIISRNPQFAGGQTEDCVL